MTTIKTAVPRHLLGPVSAIFIVLSGGCAAIPTEVRYDENIRSYSSPPTGITSTSARDEAVTNRYRVDRNEGSATYVSPPSGTKLTSSRYEKVTARYVSDRNEGAIVYSSPPSGVNSNSGKLDGITAYYTLRDGQSSNLKSDTLVEVTTEQVADDNPAPGKDGGNPPIVLAFSDVLFEFDKWDLKKSYLPELDEWVGFFHANPQVNAEIYGHTDSTGSATYNQELSEKRARAVVNYLVDKGIHRNRLTVKGFGEGKPTATNSTRKGRQENRRVEIKF